MLFFSLLQGRQCTNLLNLSWKIDGIGLEVAKQPIWFSCIGWEPVECCIWHSLGPLVLLCNHRERTELFHIWKTAMVSSWCRWSKENKFVWCGKLMFAKKMLFCSSSILKNNLLRLDNLPVQLQKNCQFSFLIREPWIKPWSISQMWSWGFFVRY